MVPGGNGENGTDQGFFLPETAGGESYTVKLPVFEGPFELLYFLIKKEKINIWDISLAEITTEYLEHLRRMPKPETDQAGSFLVMSANLLYLKSKLLLPQAPQEIRQDDDEAFFFGSKEELVHRMLEYSHFKAISSKLKQKEAEQKRIFLRSFGRPITIVAYKQAALYPLYCAETIREIFINLQNKTKKEKSIIFTFFEENSLLERIGAVLKTIREMAAGRFFLEKLLGKGDKKETVVTFFALLELARRGKVYLSQKALFGRIQISVAEKIKRGKFYG